MTIRVLLLTALTLGYGAISLSQTQLARELRGVYLTTTNSLDWPSGTDPDEQRASLRKILQEMRDAHLNALFFQVRARGDAYYRSDYEPWAENLTGTLGKQPEWDPLEFLIAEARRHNIEVHAWFNVYKIRGPVYPPSSSPLHPVRAFPSWVKQYETEWWFDPGLPEVTTYLLNVLNDLTDKYDVDGICFDFIRYPRRDFDDRATFNKHGNGMPLDEWRRENINRFVREAYRQITAKRPLIKMGAAPVGNYGGTMSAQPDTRIAAGALSDYFQDSRLWLRNGWLDYLAPQVYWTLDFETQGPDFAYITRAWLRHSGERHLYISTGPYKPEILRQLPDQIIACRMLGARGQIHFRYKNIAPLTLFGTTYSSIAIPPQMPWKDSIPPLPPSQVTVTQHDTATILTWLDSSRAAEGDNAHRYVVYRWSRNNEEQKKIVAVTSSVRWMDMEKEARFTYAVSALDRANNESRIVEAVAK